MTTNYCPPKKKNFVAPNRRSLATFLLSVKSVGYVFRYLYDAENVVKLLSFVNFYPWLLYRADGTNYIKAISISVIFIGKNMANQNLLDYFTIHHNLIARKKTSKFAVNDKAYICIVIIYFIWLI